MTQNVIQLHNATPEQLVDLILKGVHAQIENLKKDFQPKEPAEFLTRNEVSKLLKVDLSTVHNWTVKGKLKPIGIGNRVYFKRQDIEQSLIPLR